MYTSLQEHWPQSVGGFFGVKLALPLADGGHPKKTTNRSGKGQFN
jgi:hypothetical protein